ncbi:MAG: metal ABC transporter permease [Chitinispirillales bacterium]|jgi:zinc transport system permease protein|nr:metal ABC transporter permease [Chitinispirillales bacterium]
MIEEILKIFSYDFMRNAIITGSFVAISSAIIGVFLVLRKFSMIGDGLAHTSLATIALGMLFGFSPIAISIPLVIAASLFILRLSQKATIWGDSAIGFVSATAIAAAVMLASLSNGFNNDLYNYLFGNILTVSTEELWISIILSVVVVGVVIFFYRDLFMLSFDEDFARVAGVNADFLNSLTIILTAIIIVLGVRVVGTMLISSLIIIPAITALQISKNFKQTIIFSTFFAVFSVISGILLSFAFNIPSGATIVLINGTLFLGILGIKMFRK